MYLTGGSFYYTNYEIEFGSDTFSIATSTDPLVLVKYDSSGNVLCGSIIASGGDDISGIAVEPSGNYVYLSGDLKDTVNFGPDKLGAYSNIYEFPFLAKWQPCNNITTGVTDLVKNEKLTVFPNPFTSTTTILLNDDDKHYLEVDDLTGRKLRYIEFTGTQYELSAQDLAKGLYFVRVFDREKNVIGTTKIVVQ